MGPGTCCTSTRRRPRSSSRTSPLSTPRPNRKRAGGLLPRPLPPLRKNLLALRLQVHRGIFAAAIDLELELEPVALVERRHARALDRRDVHERVRLAVIALDEAEAFHRVEELDRSAGL